MKSYFQRLFHSVAWSNQRILDALRNCPAAHAEALPLLGHLLAAEHVWLSRLQGREPAMPIWPKLTLPQCHALAAENAAGWSAYIGRLGEATVGANVEYLNSRGESFRNSIADILTHVAIHRPYHRGQIAKAIGRAGGEVANTDFIGFVRNGG